VDNCIFQNLVESDIMLIHRKHPFN